MKRWIVFASLTLVTVMSVSVASAGPEPSSEKRRPPEAARPAARVQAAIESLESRLARMEQRLARLERTVAELANRPQAKATPKSAPPAFAEIFNEGRFREYVLAVLEEDRKRTQAAARATAEERRREWEELRKGPYGRFNMKINSMAKVLDLTEEQKGKYHEILTEYTERYQSLSKGTTWTDPESVNAFQKKRESAQKELDEAVEGMLTPAQVTRYRELPAWQRQAAGGTVTTPIQRTQ